MRPAPEHGAAHLLVGRGFPKEYETADPESFDDQVDAEFEQDVHERVTRRLPHLAGMDGSSTVVAVNTDGSARIYDHADVGVVADAAEVARGLLGVIGPA